MPREIVARLNTELVRIVRSPEVNKSLTEMGVNVVGSSSEEFSNFTKAEIVKWAEVIKNAKVKL